MIPYAEEKKDIDNESELDSKPKKVALIHRILLNRPAKVIAILALLTLILPLLFYQVLYYRKTDLPFDEFSTGSCLIIRSIRLPCGADDLNSTQCHPQCCYDKENHACFHRFPSRFSYILEENWTENVTVRPRINTVPFNSQDSFQQIKLSVDEITSTHVSLTFYNPNKLKLKGRRIEEKNYTYVVSQPELTVEVNDLFGRNMFNTIRGPIIASKNIWEISFLLTEEFMYGLGEIPLRDNTQKILYNHAEGLSGVPLIFAKSNGSFHGLLIDIPEPTEIRVLGGNRVVVRSITTVGLKFHIFSGPLPEDIMRDVMKMFEKKSRLEYWMLGAHICSQNRTMDDNDDNIKKFLDEATKEKLPFESHCGTKPLILESDLCVNEVRSVIDTDATLVRSYGKRFVPHVSPFIRYNEPNITSEENSTETPEEIEATTEHNLTCSNILTELEEVFLRNFNNNDFYKGQAANHPVLYPDYEFVEIEFMNKLWKDITLDGVMLQNNWPLDVSFKLVNETSKYLPYFNEIFVAAFNHTPQWNITKVNGNLYIYSHNQYGDHFTKAFSEISGTDIPIWTSSQRFAGQIVNRQNVNASWANLQRELAQSALGSVSGHWLWSSPVCGDNIHYNNETQSSLCVKWYMLATYLPILNIDSDTIRRDPLAFTGTNKMNIMTAISNRQSLLPYFFTVLQNGPLLRPMFYQFPFSESVANLNSQFSIGDDLVIVPNLLPDQTHVVLVVPPGTWYEIWSGSPIEAEEGESVLMSTTESDFLTIIRGGSILVLQKNTQETAERTRLLSDYTLTIALHCEHVNTTDETITSNDSAEITNTTECFAKGILHMTPNITINFHANSEQLNITTIGEDYGTFCDMNQATWARVIKYINIYGLDNQYNNYDHHRHVDASIDLCDLQSKEEILFRFVS